MAVVTSLLVCDSTRAGIYFVVVLTKGFLAGDPGGDFYFSVSTERT